MADNLHKIIEKQMNLWRIQRRSNMLAGEESFTPANMITISNAYGTNGVGIAHLVGEMLEVPIYDREIVEHIATTGSVRVETVEMLDQVAQSRLDDYTLSLFRERNFDQSDYLRALTRTVMALWGHGSCVMLGRGACHIVYRKYLLAVRLTASGPWRIRWLMRARDISAVQAAQDVRRIDAERAAYIRRYFDHEIEDPQIYDLVINRTGLDDMQVAELIKSAFQMKMGRPA